MRRLLLITFLPLCTGCVSTRADGDTTVYGFSLWVWAAAVPGPLAINALFLWMIRTGDRRGYIGIAVMTATAAVATPAVFLAEVRVGPDEIRFDNGFWCDRDHKAVRLSNTTLIRWMPKGSKSHELVFTTASGPVTFTGNALVEAALSDIAARARSRKVQVFADP